MAPKKFTYTPGTGGGKQTKKFAKKASKEKAERAAALKSIGESLSSRGAFGPATYGGKPGGKSGSINLNTVGMGSRSPLTKQVQGTVNTLNEITGVAPVERIAKGKGSKADIALTAMSVLPIGKVAGVAAKGGKAALSGIRGAEAVASTAKVGTKAFGKTKGVAAIKKASAAARKSDIAKRTEDDAITIKRGTQKSKTAEMAQTLEQQSAKENSSKSVFQAPESTVKPLTPAPATAKLPTGMTKAEIKKFGEKRSKALGSGGKQGRTASQRAQVAKDVEQTIKDQLAARQSGARAGVDVPGEMGARRVGGPAADAATAAPAKPKPAPKPGPKQVLRENARLTAEPTGKPKVPSARASQAVKDKYAKDLAAYEKQQAKYAEQQAKITEKTTAIEKGKVKAPSAKETGAPMVKTGKPATVGKKPATTKPVIKKPSATKPAAPAAKPAEAPKPAKPAKAETPQETKAKPISSARAKLKEIKSNKIVKRTTAGVAAASGALGVGGAIVGQAPGAKTSKPKSTYQTGANNGRISDLTARKARIEKTAVVAEKPKAKKFGAAGESKFIKGRSAVRQSTIDKINRQGMAKSLAAVKSHKNDPEYLEAIRRYYGAARLNKALKG